MKKTPKSSIDLKKRIQEGRARLADTKVKLKEHFVGLDTIIDQVIDNLETWYLMPEAVTRPVIINLWGMTGVGKTDLVRKLAKFLGFEDRFFEMQLSHGNGSASYKEKNIASALDESNLEQGEPGILLLDEVQRFRAIDERGMELHDLKYQDIWMLLSDGKFTTTVRKNEILSMIMEHEYSKDYRASYPDKNNDLNKQTKGRKYHDSFESSRDFKRLLKLDEPVVDIMTWPMDKRVKIALQSLEDKSAFESEDYTKLLIVISGNIDEAYEMADEVANGDVDADIFHEQSRSINIVDIKNALSRRFKPEHISRFGNTHIIYPSLSRSSYEEIISRHVGSFVKYIQAKHGLNLKLEKSVFDFLYKNGVFPTQGVRPVFTTCASYIENVIPRILLEAVEREEMNVVAYYRTGDLIINFGDTWVNSIVIPWRGAMDKIRDSRNEDVKTVVSVHETGHAIIYALLFGYIPSQVLSATTGFGGVTCIANNTFLSRKTLLDRIAMGMAGSVAEELIFGKPMLSAGSESDIASATDIAVKAVKELGMYGSASLVMSAMQAGSRRVNTDNSPKLDAIIEKMIVKQRKRVADILSKRLPLVKEVADIMISEGHIRPERLQAILATHGVEADLLGTSEMIIEDYQGSYEKFKTRIEKKKVSAPRIVQQKLKKGIPIGNMLAPRNDDDDDNY